MYYNYDMNNLKEMYLFDKQNFKQIDFDILASDIQLFKVTSK